MPTIRSTFVLLGLVATATQCTAAKSEAKGLDVKAGLWEQTMKEEKTPEPAFQMSPEMLADMPADARARVESVLKRQAAERAVQGNSPVVSAKTKRFCITQKQLDEGLKLPEMGRGDIKDNTKCSENKLDQSATGLHLKMVCTSQPGHGEKGAPPGEMHSAMELTVVAKSRENYTENMVTDFTFSGRHQHSQTHGEAHWIGANCGNVKSERD